MTLRSPYLRFALLLPLVVACILGALFYPMYRTAEAHIRSEVHAAIEQEIFALDDHFHDEGIQGLIAELKTRIDSPLDPDAVYLLLDATQHRLAGNLPSWPNDIPAQDESWFRISDDANQHIEGKVFLLFGGERLLVGRRSPLAEFHRNMTRRLLWSGALIVLMVGLITGFFMRQLHLRLARLAEDAQAIQQGHLSRRLSLSPRQDELDELAQRFNQAFDQIEQLLEATRHISSALAHDMRRPLIGLRNAMELALRDSAADTAIQPLLRQLIAQTDHLQQVFSALLRLAKLEAGAWERALLPCPLDVLCSDAAELYEVMAQNQGRALHAQLQPAMVMGDRDLLFQMLQNLLENALIHGSGNIELTLTTTASHATLRIRDHGPAVPENELEKVFNRFYRIDNSRSTPGSGIGLALVRGIVQSHGGRVWATCAHPGLAVTVQLPRLAPQAETLTIATAHPHL